MAGPALTPALALEYLAELSTDIRAGVLLDASGGMAASWEGDDERGERVRELVVDLLERVDAADEAAGRPSRSRSRPAPAASSALASADWTIAVVTGRYALASLMFYDLRKVLEDLSG